MDFSEMRHIQGLYYDPKTGKTYREDGSDTGFTFEAATWTGPAVWAPLIGAVNFVGGAVTGSLNPLGFATQETAEAVLDFAADALAGTHLSLAIDATDRVVGPFSRTIEREIEIRSGDRRSSFSAGQLAVQIAKHGQELARVYFRAELRLAGLL